MWRDVEGYGGTRGDGRGKGRGVEVLGTAEHDWALLWALLGSTHSGEFCSRKASACQAKKTRRMTTTTRSYRIKYGKYPPGIRGGSRVRGVRGDRAGRGGTAGIAGIGDRGRRGRRGRRGGYRRKCASKHPPGIEAAGFGKR